MSNAIVNDILSFIFQLYKDIVIQQRDLMPCATPRVCSQVLVPPVI